VGSILVFEFAGHLCGMRAADVREIVFLPQLTRLAGQPPLIDGFLDLRGRAVPVVRLERLFDAPARTPTLHAPLVIASAGGTTLALAVDRVDDVVPLDDGDWRPVGNGHSFNQCAVAAFDFDGRGATLLDCRRILLEKERQCVEELRARAQAELETLGPPAR
jgi:purine-binding chemotaxis protein CheW